MYDISVNGYKVIKSTWGAYQSTDASKKFTVLASTKKGARLKQIDDVTMFDRVKEIIAKLAKSGAPYISVQVIVDEPNGGHWHIYYKLHSNAAANKSLKAEITETE